MTARDFALHPELVGPLNAYWTEANRESLSRHLDGTPIARTTDPVTSHEAAAAVKPANRDLIRCIRTVVECYDPPMTQEKIARIVSGAFPDRWLPATVVTACNPKRSGLKVVGYTTNSRGRRVQLLGLP